MKYRKLGNTDINVSNITFGCWELGGQQWEFTSDETNIKVLQYAFESGITSFDTAEGYGDGHSEEITGKALKGKRQQCFIATKVSPKNLRPKDARAALEASLKRLGTDYADLYYMHRPNDEVPIEETMSEFNKFKKEGLIRAIGVSNFSLEQLKKAVEFGRIDAIQPEYSLLQRDIENDGMLQFCVENSISIMSYSSIAKGILTGMFHLGGVKLADNDFRRTRRMFLPEHLEKETELINLMKEIADNKGCKLSQIAISWLLCQKGLTSAIVGTQSEKHLMENIVAVDLELSGKELNQLTAVSTKVLESF